MRTVRELIVAEMLDAEDQARIIPGSRVHHKRLDLQGTVGTAPYQGSVLVDAGGQMPVTWRVDEIVCIDGKGM